MLISSKVDDEKLVEIMKLLDWSFANWDNYKVLYTGIQGVHWDYDTSIVDEATAKAQRVVKVIENNGYYNDFCLSISLPYESKETVYNSDGTRNMHNKYVCEYVDDFDTCKVPLDGNFSFDSGALKENIPT